MNLILGALFGAIFMFFGVLLGALGSHALAEKLSANSMVSFMVAVRYLIYHGLALLMLSGLPSISEIVKERVVLLLVTGTVVFSLSILLLSTKSIHGLAVSFLGPITPIGGLILLLGWGYLIVQFIRVLF
jgi:uncharacterized membrane protein YgdD (TMEM256/DUF423 family)